jgi:hypothetical protein
MDKQTIDKITAQAINEISWARTYKQGKVKNWQKNEDLYYGKKQSSVEARANVDLGRMQEFVHTLLSKIDNPLVFKFIKRKEAQLQRVKRLNALRQQDSQNDNWDIKDLVGKKQGLIYGRAVFSYYADSIAGYQAHLDNVDVYDYLIDPSAGGIDIERAMYMGNYGVVFTRQELEELKKDEDYQKDAIATLLTGAGNNTETTQEENNKAKRMYGQNTIGQKELQNDDKFKFWRWFTTYEGVRYYLVLQESSSTTIRIKPLTDLFSPTRDYKLGAWPYWTWAAFPDLTEFWTPAYCDYVREIFMAQNVSINQMLDNAEAINKPQKIVDSSAIENMASLKYKRDGNIVVRKGADASKAIQFIRPSQIDTPIAVYKLLEAIQEKASGVTAGSKGVEDTGGKVGIYQGNQEASADRFGLLNKSYSFGYKRFAKLYEIGVRDNLIKKVAVDMIGPNGIETEEISRKDVFKKTDDYGVMTEASNAETMASVQEQEIKMKFLTDPSLQQNPEINKKKVFEIKAQIAGFSEDEIKQMQDTSEFGNQELMAEADRDLEAILDGEKIKPNANANNAYKQKIVSWAKDHEEDMTAKQFIEVTSYIRSLDEIININEARAINAHEINLLNQGAPAGGAVATDINNNPDIKNNGSQI